MSYKTILKYQCDKCLKETVFPETEKGPIFDKEGWVTVRIDIHTYHNPYVHYSSRHVDGLYCPDCAHTYGVRGVAEFLLRGK